MKGFLKLAAFIFVLQQFSTLAQANCLKRYYENCLAKCEYHGAVRTDRFLNKGPTAGLNNLQDMLIEEMESHNHSELEKQARAQRQIRELDRHSRRQMTYAACDADCLDEADEYCY